LVLVRALLVSVSLAYGASSPSSLKESSVRHPVVIHYPFPVLSISSGLPYAMSRAGFVTGLFLLVVLCYVTDWTICLIVTNAKLSGTNSYIGIMNRSFGASGRAAVSFFQFSFAFGGTYVLTITDTKLLITRDRNVRLRDYHRRVCSRLSLPPELIPSQEIRYRMSSFLSFPTSLPYLSSHSLPIVDS